MAVGLAGEKIDYNFFLFVFRLIINDSLESGTQIPYIKKAKKAGYAVLVMNTNDNYRIMKKERVFIKVSSPVFRLFYFVPLITRQYSSEKKRIYRRCKTWLAFCDMVFVPITVILMFSWNAFLLLLLYRNLHFIVTEFG